MKQLPTNFLTDLIFKYGFIKLLFIAPNHTVMPLYIYRLVVHASGLQSFFSTPISWERKVKEFIRSDSV